MSDILIQKMQCYCDTKKLKSKGQLAIVLHLSRVAKEKGLPLDPKMLITENKGQVSGLGKAAVQKILAEYGIYRVLAEEAGRTSRGSIGIMQEYVSFLNELYDAEIADMEVIEQWWVERVKDYFNSKPFVLRYDTSKTIRATVRDLLTQAEDRQKEVQGTTYVGTVLQHLVGAKLSLLLGSDKVKSHGASVADSPTDRNGDFLLDDVVIHCTTAPGQSLMEKCRDNINSGLKPIIVTLYSRLLVGEAIAADCGLDGRIEIWDIEQFLATNVYEISSFKSSDRKVTVERLIQAYNEIISKCETDPSLRIQI